MTARCPHCSRYMKHSKPGWWYCSRCDARFEEDMSNPFAGFCMVFVAIAGIAILIGMLAQMFGSR